ncbi:MAG: hypothetical protein US65_C0044G0006 [Candidatus Yanofskybacteria bacterium GW2011_GWC2_37_9]|uniref:POTRA domain-containing protein n=1 Tax=Candidatus Yanofskybacteria bacterium GW2011_GWC2_37_9 TaxID=1619028 RepID=A0A0G0L0C6_9BACT|nr:MAG: hypothetical protein US65_C0044G0006 [Candidatus Yanofskybacteria bacterium GW2011_GWC2_37_9]
MKRNILNSPRLLKLKKKRQKIFLNKIFLSVISLLTVFAGLSYLSGLKQLNITEVKINGNKSIDSEMAKIIAQKEITGNYLWFFPKTNILFYPKNNIKNELQNEFKRLKDAVFSIKDGKTLEISLIEREASYMWCDTTLPESDVAGQKCYFMDLFLMKRHIFPEGFILSFMEKYPRKKTTYPDLILQKKIFINLFCLKKCWKI